MTSRLPQTTPGKMIRALQKRGFWVRAVDGSHYIMTDGVHKTTVPFHSRELPRWLLMEIIKQAGLSIDEIQPYL